jgi:hypothetical protein
MKIISAHHGSATTCVKVAGYDGAPLATWYRDLAAAVRALDGTGDFEVSLPQECDFVGTVVAIQFRGKTFSLGSDIPGELLLSYGSLRPRYASELVDAMSAAWENDAV